MNNKLGFIVGNGEFNVPYVSIDSIDFEKSGVFPKISGACMGIVSINNKLYFLMEDDDNYSELCELTINELKEFTTSLKDVVKHIEKGKGMYDLSLPINYSNKILISKRQDSIVKLLIKKNVEIDINLFWLNGWLKNCNNALNIIEDNKNIIG